MVSCQPVLQLVEAQRRASPRIEMVLRMYEKNPRPNPGKQSGETMPRVLIVDLAKYYGGADVRVLELARTLERLGHTYLGDDKWRREPSR